MTWKEFVSPRYVINTSSVAASKELGRNAELRAGAALGPLEVQTLRDTANVTVSLRSALPYFSGTCSSWDL